MTSYAHIRASELLELAPVETQIDEFTIVSHGRFQPGGNGRYPAIPVICARDAEHAPFAERPYSVHLLVARCDSGGMSAPKIRDLMLIEGQYDVDLDTAKTLLDAR